MTQPDDTSWAQAAEARVLQAAVGLAADCGWNRALVVRAAAQAGLSDADAALLLPAGPRDLAALLFRRHDAAALSALADVDPTALKVRERIRQAVEARVEAAAADVQAVKRCTAFLALPTNVPLGLSLLWASADALWRWAGDTATDENHYTKRAILSGVLATTVAVRLERGANAASAHLDARIANVMAFEKWKAGWPKPSEHLATLAGALARRRYP
ncbi:MAG: rpsU-divergently transcribed protein [Caulobacterales bacterium 32-69-10]|nr:MAG: rpsU-divergently transcribed protein [Caulobacterales bacterium 32-69-10]